jgi:hypothetical protein
MPVAVLVHTPERFELKSLPGGYVVIRRMTYGEKLQRSEMTMSMRMDMADKKNMGADMKMLSRQVTLWSFSRLITEHNLENADGRPLNFKNPVDVESLDGMVGEEIDTYVDKVNNFEEDEEALGNSNSGSKDILS